MLDIFIIVAVICGLIMASSSPDDEYDNYYPDNDL